LGWEEDTEAGVRVVEAECDGNCRVSADLRNCRDKLIPRRCRILAKAETKRQRKRKALKHAPAGTDDHVPSDPKHEPAFEVDTPPPTARMTELTATYYHTPVACMSVGTNWQFPIPVEHLTHEQLTGLVRRGLLVVALPPWQNADDWGVETLSAVPTAGPWEERDRRTGRERERENVGVPALTVVPPSPLPVSPVHSNEMSTGGAGAFSSFFSRAKTAREQYLKPTAHPTTTTSSSSHSSSVPSSPSMMTASTSTTSITEILLSPPMLPPAPVPSSPLLSSGSVEARKSTEALSVRSSDSVTSMSIVSGGSRTSQWVSWASSKWGR
jgi:hypothetical protein